MPTKDYAIVPDYICAAWGASDEFVTQPRDRAIHYENVSTI